MRNKSFHILWWSTEILPSVLLTFFPSLFPSFFTCLLPLFLYLSFNPSFLPFLLVSHCFLSLSFLPPLLHSFLSSFLFSFLPSFLPFFLFLPFSILPSICPSFFPTFLFHLLHSFLPFVLPSFSPAFLVASFLSTVYEDGVTSWLGLLKPCMNRSTVGLSKGHGRFFNFLGAPMIQRK